MKKIAPLLFFTLLFCGVSFAQDTLLAEGNYEGKNLYIQNPFAEDGKGFCTKQVLVNNISVAFDSASAYEIDLAALNLKTGDKVKIEIVHSAGCSPKILHPEMRCHPICQYSIFAIKIEQDSMLTWTSAEQNGKFIYIVEQFRWNKWVKLGEVESRNGFDTVSYSFNLNKYFTSGSNKFRVKVVNASENIYSQAAEIEKPDLVKSFKAQDAAYYRKNPVEFERETMWEIFDKDGNMIKKGYGKIVVVKDLKHGSYFLCYENMIVELYL